MTFDDLKSMVEKDLVIDQYQLDESAIVTPRLFAKYLNLQQDYRMKLKAAQHRYNTHYKEQWEYYTGKAEPAVYKKNPFPLKIMKGEVDMYLKADEGLNKLDARMQYYKSMVDYLDGVLKAIQTRSFDIKHAIEWRRFTSGA